MTDTQTVPGVVLTDVAQQKVRSLLESEGRDDLSLRIAVQPGGCSGLRYQLYFDDRILDGDVTTEYDGVTVVTDKRSGREDRAHRRGPAVGRADSGEGVVGDNDPGHRAVDHLNATSGQPLAVGWFEGSGCRREVHEIVGPLTDHADLMQAQG